MGEGRGGYQPPTNPAPVSGPGALSQRTDVQAPMDMTGGPYGEATEMASIQAGADMFAEPSAPAPPLLSAPTNRPDLPVTDGAVLGAGRGPEAMSSGSEAANEMLGLQTYMPMMKRMAARDDAPRAFRALVQFIEASNG